MIRRDSQVTVTDLFCGAGGWTEGAEQAGALVRWGVNHWPRACETYERNHPNAKVDCNDISSTNPGRYPRTDILIASPECTTHSPAGGSRPRRSLWTDEDDPALLAELARIERSRVTMLDVVRFAEHHRYDAIIVENVVEVRRWELFDWWLTGLHNLGYEHQAVYMNSMVAWPTPQSRDRVYFVFWRKGNKKPDLRFDVACWCPKCERQVQGIQSWKNPAKPWGKYRTQYVYRCPSCTTVAWPFAYPAATAIDWSLPAPRIGDRKKPLAPATLARIRAGLERFGLPFYIKNYGNLSEAKYRPHDVREPLGAITSEDSHGLVVDTAYGGDDGHVRTTEMPWPSQTARQTQALVVSMRSGSDASRVASADQPLSTVVATSSTHAVVIPMLQHTRPGRADLHPMPTMTAGHVNGALLVPAGGTWNDDAKPVSEPMRARTARENEGVLIPPGFVMVNRTHNVGVGLDEPVPPVMTGNHQYLVMRNNDGARLTPTDEPLGTLTGAGHQSLLRVPFLVGYYSQGGGQYAPISQPMGTVDTRDRRALVIPDEVVDDCGFRMLEPHEIKAAMAFRSDYVITGNKREQVKQAGNAVTPPVSFTIVPRVIAALDGEAA